MKPYFKINERLKKIFNYFSIFTIVLGTTFGSINSAYAGDGDDALVETETGTAYDSGDDLTTGLLIDADGDGAIAITIDSDGGVTLGAAGDDDAITSESTGTPVTTIAITDSDTSTIETVTFAGDIEVGAAGGDEDDTLTINSTNTNLYIGNNVVGANAGNVIAFTAGSGGDVTITVDNDAAEAQSINATITGSTNTVTLNVTDTGGNAGLTSFEKAISVTNLNINPTNNETAEVKFKAAVTASTIVLGENTDSAGDDTAVTFEVGTADYTVTGTIDNALAADETSITITDATDGGAPDTITFASNIGSSVAIDAINVGTANIGGDAIFSGNVSTTTLTITGGGAAAEDSVADFDGNLTAAVALDTDDGESTIKFTGAVAQEMTGAITAAGDGEGNLATANTTSTVTFDAIGTAGNKLKTVSVAASNQAIFGAAVSSNTLTITGQATLQANNNTSETLVFADGATIILDDTITNGQVVFNEVAGTAPDIDAGAKIYLPTNLSDGQTLTFFLDEDDNTIGDADGNDTELDATMQNTALMSYDAALNEDADGGGLGGTIVTATAKAEATTASELSVTTNNARSLKQALAAAISDTNADADAEDAFANAMNAIGGYSATEDTALAKQVAPQDDMISGSTFATKAMTGSLQGIMSNRMASLRSGDAYYGSGMSAGANMSANSGFIQVFGTDAEQKNKTVGSGTQFGYDATSSGVALGFDGITDNGSVVGLSLSMSETDVDGKGTGKSKNDIDSYTASIYMDKSTDAGYVEGSLTVGLNENNSSRIVNTAGLNRTYKGDYDSEQVSLKIGGGKPNAVGMSGYVTPFGSITATRISTDAYTETSTTANDNLRLRVAQDDVDSVVGTVGLKYHNVLDNGGSPMISLAINNEFGDSTINSTNTYQGGGSSFKTSTDVEELSATLGLGYSFSSDNASIEFAYEADANDDDYLSHYGSIKLVSKF
jgi:hypothetical protein